MTTSETFSQTAGQIIINALRDARIIAAEQPVQDIDFSNGLTAIQNVIKHWQTQGIHLWSETEALLPLNTAQRKYLLGPSGDDCAVAKTFFNTTLTQDIAAPEANIFTVDPVTTTVGWTTTSASVAVVANGLEVTNTAALAGSAAFDFTTVTNSQYTIGVSYIEGSSGSTVITLTDVIGTLESDTWSSDAVWRYDTTARDTTTTFTLTNGSAGIGDDNIVGELTGSSNNVSIQVAATSGTTFDGQAISMSGAPDILSTNPALSTGGWIPGLSTLTRVDDGLQVANSIAFAGGVQFVLDTVIDTTYQVDFSIASGTSDGGDFDVFDTTGTLDARAASVPGAYTMEFTARDLTTTFQMFNRTAGSGDFNVISSLNYRDKTSGDRIGIELASGTRYWDNIVTVDSTTQVTINNEIPSAATSGAVIYTYGTAIARPMRILNARFAEDVTASEIPTKQWSREEYFEQPDKDSTGTVVKWYYTPILTNGALFVWQVANTLNQVLRFTYVDPIDIPTETDDNLEFPSEWYLPLKWAIAAELGPSYGLPDNRQLILESKAVRSLQEALDFDVERQSMSLQPDFR